MYNLNHERKQITEYLHAQLEVFDQMQQSNNDFLETVEPLSACLGFIGMRAGYYTAMRLIKAVLAAHPDADDSEELELTHTDLQLREQLLDCTYNVGQEIVTEVQKNNPDLNDLDAPADADGIVQANFEATMQALLSDNDEE